MSHAKTARPSDRLTRLSAGLTALLATAGTALANPTQEEVFRSISNNVDHPIDGTKALAVVAAIVGAIVLGVVVSRWRQHRATVKVRSRNQPAVLLRELARAVGLRRDQVRQLRVLNARLAAEGRDVQNLATLLLCPSLIRRAEAMHADPASAMADAARA